MNGPGQGLGKERISKLPCHNYTLVPIRLYLLIVQIVPVSNCVLISKYFISHLAYVMADAGYDVWIPNSRGNFYSRKHLWKNPNFHASGFWEFSWDDMAISDLPAIFDFVCQATSHAKVFLVAHSQGSSEVMALLSERPEYNDYVQAASLLAPVSFLNHSAKLYRTLGGMSQLFMVIGIFLMKLFNLKEKSI